MIKDLLTITTSTVFAVANISLANPQSQERAEIYDQSIKASAAFYCEQMDQGKEEDKVLNDVFYLFVEQTSAELGLTQIQFINGLSKKGITTFWNGFNFYGRKQCPQYWEQDNNDYSEV
jgi:hypothetical protein